MGDRLLQNPFRGLWKNGLTSLVKNSILNLWVGYEHVTGFKYVRVLNIRKFSLIWQGSEYGFECNYGMVLNIPWLRVCQVCAYASVAQGSEYAWIWLNNALKQGSEYAWSTFHRFLNKPPAQNMARMWICERYTGCWICLNKPEYALIMSQYAW